MFRTCTYVKIVHAFVNMHLTEMHFFRDKMRIQLQRLKYTYVCENFLKLLILIGECRHRLLDFADIHM